MGYKTRSVLNLKQEIFSSDKISDCIVCTTDSRANSQFEAYQKILNTLKKFSHKNTKLFSKRIDSTLRGNLGSETDAFLDFLGDDYTAICAPCFPESGRTLVGGYLLVEGLPLHKTNIAIDPKTPVKTSDIAKIFAQQSKYKIASLHLTDLMDGKHSLAKKINDLVENNNRIIIIDCITSEDLNLIADAVITSKHKIIAVDPGAFTATLARKIITPSDKKERLKVLAVVGSVNPNTKSQMENLWLAQRPIKNIFVETKKLLESENERQQEISRVTDFILEAADLNTVLTVTGDGIYPEKRIDFSIYIEKYKCTLDEITNKINYSLAEIALRILKNNSAFKGLYVSGGDVTQALCETLGASGLDLKDEVLPLAAYGLLSGGDFDGLHVITKGGSQGDSNAINLCVNYLKSKLFI